MVSTSLSTTIVVAAAGCLPVAFSKTTQESAGSPVSSPRFWTDPSSQTWGWYWIRPLFSHSAAFFRFWHRTWEPYAKLVWCCWTRKWQVRWGSDADSKHVFTHNFPLMSLTLVDSSCVSKSIFLTSYSRSYLSLSSFAMMLWYSLHKRRSSSRKSVSRSPRTGRLLIDDSPSPILSVFFFSPVRSAITRRLSAALASCCRLSSSAAFLLSRI